MNHYDTAKELQKQCGSCVQLAVQLYLGKDHVQSPIAQADFETYVKIYK